MNAVFRCDATAAIGFGHLSRCIALAEAFRPLAVHAVFAGRFDPAAKDQIALAGFRAVDLASLVNERAPDGELPSGVRDEASFVVVDSYRADEAYLAALRAPGRGTVVIDDFRSLADYPCDVVLNFTWEARDLGYPQGPALLLGPEYLLAREQLANLRPRSVERDRRGPVRNLLIAIGGSDPKRIAARLIGPLRDARTGVALRVVAANDADLGTDVGGFLPGSRVLPRQPDLSEQLLWADACITGGGLIKYESAFMGVPAAAISQNEGQARETRVLARAGLVFDLGLADPQDQELANALGAFLADDDLRAALATRAADVFPPHPTARAARAILKAVRH